MAALIVIGLILVLGLMFALTRSKTGVGRGTGTSIKRGRSSHYNIDGRPKKSYDSAEHAALAARRLQARGQGPMNAYQCRDCGKFHLGHG